MNKLIEYLRSLFDYPKASPAVDEKPLVEASPLPAIKYTIERKCWVCGQLMLADTVRKRICFSCKMERRRLAARVATLKKVPNKK